MLTVSNMSLSNLLQVLFLMEPKLTFTVLNMVCHLFFIYIYILRELKLPFYKTECFNLFKLNLDCTYKKSTSDSQRS